MSFRILSCILVMDTNNKERKLAVIMFADIVGYTAMMQDNEALALLARERHRSAINEFVGSHQGEVVQYYGDGALLLFPSARKAVIAAHKIQTHLRIDPIIPVRIGIHLGEVTQDKDGIYGDCVNLASRIESIAVPGSVMFSDKVYSEISNNPDLPCVSYGEFEFKNVKRPISVYALHDSRIIIPSKNELISGKGKQKERVIALMPFQDLGVEEDYFAVGISEEIMNGLIRIDGLSVISTTSSKQIYDSGDQKLFKARSIGVSHLLEGKVRRAGRRVRVTVQLLNTSDGYHIWGERYDAELNDIFEVQDEIARKIINALQVNFKIGEPGNEVLDKPTQNMEAYTLYLKGMHHWKRNNPEDVTKALAIFQKALSLDDRFASAQCAISQCYSFLGSCGKLVPTDAYAKALNFAMNAIEKNPRLAEAHLAIANIKFYNFWDWKAAKISLEKAKSLGLHSAGLYQLFGLYYAAVGNPKTGVDEMRKALSLDPLSVPVLSTLGTLLLFNEQYEDALSVYDEVLNLEPSFRSVIQYKGIALYCQGQYDKAVTTLQEYHYRVNHPQKGLAGLTIAHFKKGDLDKVKAYLNRIHSRLDTEKSAAVEVDLAIVYAGIGEFERATYYLRRVYAQRLSVACMGVIWVMRCPCFKAMWESPYYKELSLEMGFEASEFKRN